MAIVRKVNAIWNGSGKDGEGHLSSKNNFFDKTPYSFKSRFENEDGKLGTNPEELIAAAHAGCFAMALSVALSKMGNAPDYLDVNASVKLEQDDGGFSISQITLDLEGKVEGITEEQFKEAAQNAKDGCPISKALGAVPIEMNAKYIS